MALSDDLEGVAQDLLTEFGFNATLIRNSARTSTGPSYQPVFGAAPTATVRIFDWEEEIRDRSGQVTGTRRKVLISTSAGVVPDESDLLTIDSKDHRLEALKPITLQNSAIIYQAELVN